MIKKPFAVIVLAVATVFVLCAAGKEVQLSEISDERVHLFMDEYAGDFDPDEFVGLVDTVDDIFFSYDDEFDEYSVYIVYPDGNMSWLEFRYSQLNMYYVDRTFIPQEKRADALEIINLINSEDYQLGMGILVMEDGFLGCRYIVLDDGVTDAGQWAFWNFYCFESYAMNATYDTLLDLGL